MRRRGFALAAVLFALVLLGALTAAGFFAALQEARTGRNAASLVRAQAASASVIAAVIDGWDPRAMNSLSPGASVAPSVPPLPGVIAQADVRRLGARLFLIRATASLGATGRTLAALVRLRALEVPPRAAVRARSVDASLLSGFDGIDRAPPGWVCPVTSDTVPPLIQQPGATDSAFFQFGDRDWAEVVAWASSIAAGGDSLEVRYEAGNVTLTGSRSIGTLIVGGDLILDGGAELAGIVLVRGALVLRGAGGAVFGALVASQVVAKQGYTANRPVVAYSSCAVLAAGLSRALPAVLPGLPAIPVY